MAKKQKHILNEISEKVIVCNLERREDRLEKIKDDFNSRSIEFERFNAIDGDLIEGIEDNTEKRYNRYSEALIRSFKAIIEKAKSDGLANILFFEDDVFFIKDEHFKEELNRIQTLSSYDIFMLGCMHLKPAKIIPFGFTSEAKKQVTEKGIEYQSSMKKVGVLKRDYQSKEVDFNKALKPIESKLATEKLQKKPLKVTNVTQKKIHDLKSKYQDVFDSINLEAKKYVDKCKGLQDEIKDLTDELVLHGKASSIHQRIVRIEEIRGCHAMLISSSCFDDIINFIEENKGIVLEEVINNIIAKNNSYSFHKNIAFQSSGLSDISGTNQSNKEFHR